MSIEKRTESIMTCIANIYNTGGVIQNDDFKFIANQVEEIKKEIADVKHGRWISQGDDMWLCSNCKKNLIFSMHESDRTEKQRYCCRCGARMDLGDVDG